MKINKMKIGVMFFLAILIICFNVRVKAVDNKEEDKKIMLYDKETNTSTEVELDDINEITKITDCENRKVYKTSSYTPPRYKNNIPQLISPLANKEGESKIYNTNVSPYQKICRLTYGNGETVGTGTLIGNKYLLTNAHCIWDEDNNNTVFENWIANAGSYGNSFIARSGWSQVYYVNSWMSNHNAEDDWAICILNESIGDVVGWMGVSYYYNNADMKDLNISCVGYPGAHSGYYPYLSIGKITNVYDKTFRSSCYVTKGYSGGPTYQTGTEDFVLGITKSYYSQSNDQLAVRINQDIIRIVQSF